MEASQKINNSTPGNTDRKKKTTTLILKAHSSIIENCQDGTWQPKCP